MIFAIAAFLWIAGSVDGNPEETVSKDGRMPHLFIFKKLSNGTSTRHKKNANFILVDTLYRQNGTNGVKYSPLVSENYVSTTPASVPRNHNPTRRSADPTPSPNFPTYSSTVSYQYTTTDGMGYVHVEIGKGATTQHSIASFTSPTPTPKPHIVTPPPQVPQHHAFH